MGLKPGKQEKFAKAKLSMDYKNLWCCQAIEILLVFIPWMLEQLIYRKQINIVE